MKNFNEDEEPKCYAETFLQEMRKRKERGEDEGGLYYFFKVQKGKNLGSFTHQQLVIACGDLWGAGFETTVTALRMAFHFMVNSLVLI